MTQKKLPQDKITNTSEFKTGYIVIAGRPNVGKSTLLNQILGQKIAIISEKPNTTRNRILGVKTLSNAQLVFLDTPGIHHPKKQLNKYMVHQALRCAQEADLCYLMIQADEPWLEDDLLSLDNLKKLSLPIILVINKIDLVAKSEILPIIEHSTKLTEFKEIIPISALYADGIDPLINVSIQYLPPAPALFPEDMLTDQAERFIVSEIIREKLFLYTHQEVPYSTAVVVEEWKEKENLIYIKAIIYLERESQKGIVIGEQGKMIKKIGQSAREDIEQLLGSKVYLELKVKISKNWTQDPKALQKFGYR